MTARPILQRLFGADRFIGALGVRIDAVPVGRTEWPLLITGGAAPVQKAEGSAADAAVPAVVHGTETLKPKRLTGQYEYTHEQGGAGYGAGGGAAPGPGGRGAKRP